MKARLAVLWRRMQWRAVRQLGWHGALGLVLMAAALAAALAGRGFEAERQQLLQRHVADLDARVRVSAAAASAPMDPRDAAWQALPADSRRGATVAQLLRLLEAARVEVRGAQYRLEDSGAGLRRLRVTVPVRGGYAGVRSLAVTVLNRLPNAALDGFELDSDDENAQLTGQLRLSLFFRKEGA